MKKERTFLTARATRLGRCGLGEGEESKDRPARASRPHATDTSPDPAPPPGANRDGGAWRRIEAAADDKVEMDWLACPCHVAPSALNGGRKTDGAHRGVAAAERRETEVKQNENPDDV